jgi:anaphase-promoting complex subunit 5
MEHGFETAKAVSKIAGRRFPEFDRFDRRSGSGWKPGSGSKTSTAAATVAISSRFESILRSALARGQYHRARSCVSALAAVSPAPRSWDSETGIETLRATGAVKILASDYVGARAVASTCAGASKHLETGGGALMVKASIDLAETYLRADAFAQALPHAFAAEHASAVLRLDGDRAAAVAVVAECLLGLDGGRGGAFAAAAKEALDAHAPGVLGKGGASVRARARLAAGTASQALQERRVRGGGA